ncbi:hypothetical protein ACV3OO_11810 [Clostridium perfringens]|nr:hypothetical protein [Clostridium perfringens]
MAKELQLTQLNKKGLKAEFNLVGAAKINDKTFNVDIESSKENSDWIYSRLNLGVDCGQDGIIYAGMQSGYGKARENVIYVHGVKEENGRMVDDYENRFTIDWEDRFDEQVLETLGEGNYIKVGIMKDDEDKVVVEKFLTPYDTVKYLKDHLENGMIVNIKGDLEYKIWDDRVTYDKKIKSIFLSKAEKEQYRATFTQTIFIDDNAIGKLDKETRTIPVTGYVVELIKEYNGQKLKRMENGKQKNGQYLPLVKTFTFEIGEDKDKALKLLKQFKSKSKKDVDKITIDGRFSRGSVDTVAVTIDDIQDKDILEMIELGYIKAEDVLNQMAKANNSGSSPESMMLLKPRVKFVENQATGLKIPQIDKVEKAYKIEDFTISLILENLCIKEDEEPNVQNDNNQEISEDEALNQVLNGLSDDDEDDWLKGLEG